MINRAILSFIVLVVLNSIKVKAENNNNIQAQLIQRADIKLGEKKIKCTELNLSDKIKKCVFSDKSTYVYLYLSESKNIYCFDYKNNKTIWYKDYNPNFLLDIVDTIVLSQEIPFAGTSKLKYLNANNGQLINETNFTWEFYLCNKLYGLGLSPYGQPTIYNFSTGKNIWSLPKDNMKFNGIHDIVFNDDNIFLLSNNLFKIQVDTGLQWTHTLNSAENMNFNRSGGFATHFNLTSLFSRDETQYPRSESHSSLYRSKKNCGLASNLLLVNKSIYVADKEYIININYNDGKESWKTKLPYSLTGRTELFNYGKNIILINTGTSENNDEFIEYGNPYFAVFDSKNGELQYKSELYIKSNRILYIKDSTNLLLMVFTDRIIEFNKTDYTTKDIVLSKEQIKQYGYFQTYIDKDIYPQWNLGRYQIVFPQDFIKHDIELYDITNKKAAQISSEFLIPTQKGTMSFNKNFEDIRFYNFNQLAIKKYENANFIFIAPLSKKCESWNYLSLDTHFEFIDKTSSVEIGRIELESGQYRVINNYFLQVLRDGILIYDLESK